jgi:hypothetical protein
MEHQILNSSIFCHATFFSMFASLAISAQALLLHGNLSLPYPLVPTIHHPAALLMVPFVPVQSWMAFGGQCFGQTCIPACTCCEVSFTLGTKSKVAPIRRRSIALGATGRGWHDMKNKPLQKTMGHGLNLWNLPCSLTTMLFSATPTTSDV